jgi:hypothetical protein
MILRKASELVKGNVIRIDINMPTKTILNIRKFSFDDLEIESIDIRLANVRHVFKNDDYVEIMFP